MKIMKPSIVPKNSTCTVSRIQYTNYVVWAINEHKLLVCSWRLHKWSTSIMVKATGKIENIITRQRIILSSDFDFNELSYIMYLENNLIRVCGHLTVLLCYVDRRPFNKIWRRTMEFLWACMGDIKVILTFGRYHNQNFLTWSLRKYWCLLKTA